MIVIGSYYFLLTLLTPYDQNIDFCFPLFKGHQKWPMHHHHVILYNMFMIIGDADDVQKQKV